MCFMQILFLNILNAWFLVIDMVSTRAEPVDMEDSYVL